jgi:hypothetical protein
MSMIVKTLESGEYHKWNSFVESSPQGDVFCHSWWLEAITKSHFKIIVLIENNEIVAGMPIAFDDRNYINQPPVTRTLGILYKPQGNLSEYKKASDQRKWLTALVEQLPLENFIQMMMHHNFTDWLPFRWKGFKQTTRYTYIIDYKGKTIDDLWNNVEKDKRRVVRRATENGFRVEESDDFALLYHFECLSYERQGLKFRLHFADLRLLDDAIKRNNNRKILMVSDKSNRIHAMAYVAFNSKSAYGLLSGSEPKYRKQGGHTLLMWELVKYFYNKVEYFNFGGSDIKSIEAYIRGFGGTQTPYFHIFNESLMDNRPELRYHLREIIIQFIEVWKIFKKKTLRVLHIK